MWKTSEYLLSQEGEIFSVTETRPDTLSVIIKVVEIFFLGIQPFIL